MSTEQKNDRLTFRLPKKLKSQAKKEARRRSFRSLGEYVHFLIQQDVEAQAG